MTINEEIQEICGKVKGIEISAYVLVPLKTCPGKAARFNTTSNVPGVRGPCYFAGIVDLPADFAPAQK